MWGLGSRKCPNHKKQKAQTNSLIGLQSNRHKWVDEETKTMFLAWKLTGISPVTFVLYVRQLPQTVSQQTCFLALSLKNLQFSDLSRLSGEPLVNNRWAYGAITACREEIAWLPSCVCVMFRECTLRRNLLRIPGLLLVVWKSQSAKRGQFLEKGSRADCGFGLLAYTGTIRNQGTFLHVK